MTKANKDKKYVAGERLLFHGTDSKFIHSEGEKVDRDAKLWNIIVI